MVGRCRVSLGLTTTAAVLALALGPGLQARADDPTAPPKAADWESRPTQLLQPIGDINRDGTGDILQRRTLATGALTLTARDGRTGKALWSVQGFRRDDLTTPMAIGGPSLPGVVVQDAQPTTLKIAAINSAGKLAWVDNIPYAIAQPPTAVPLTLVANRVPFAEPLSSSSLLVATATTSYVAGRQSYVEQPWVLDGADGAMTRAGAPLVSADGDLPVLTVLAGATGAGKPAFVVTTFGPPGAGRLEARSASGQTIWTRSDIRLPTTAALTPFTIGRTRYLAEAAWPNQAVGASSQRITLMRADDGRTVSVLPAQMILPLGRTPRGDAVLLARTTFSRSATTTRLSFVTVSGREIARRVVALGPNIDERSVDVDVSDVGDVDGDARHDYQIFAAGITHANQEAARTVLLSSRGPTLRRLPSMGLTSLGVRIGRRGDAFVAVGLAGSRLGVALFRGTSLARDWWRSFPRPRNAVVIGGPFVVRSRATACDGIAVMALDAPIRPDSAMFVIGADGRPWWQLTYPTPNGPPRLTTHPHTGC